MKRTLNIYGLRVAVATLIYTFLHLTNPVTRVPVVSWFEHYAFHWGYTVVTVLLIWEVVQRVIQYAEDNYHKIITSWRGLIALFGITALFTFPLMLATCYFFIYYLDAWLAGSLCEDPSQKLFQLTLKAEVLLWLVIGLQIVKVYYEHTRNIERKADRMQKELLISKYESLKNQVNPHFLFNSFSVLTSLIQQDKDLATDFLAQLSKMYRYMLENKESQLVSLEKEIDFLNSYIFLLKTRHEENIKIEIDVNLNRSEFYIPTLSLQMLIENAIKHNKFSEQDPLRIEIYNEGTDYLVIRNRVNKKFIAESTTKVGLENIKKRYDYQSENKVVVAHDSEHFTVKLPRISTLSLT
ncbi:MAG: histidine kinase [Bacteroidota bacterium]